METWRGSAADTKFEGKAQQRQQQDQRIGTNDDGKRKPERRLLSTATLYHQILFHWRVYVICARSVQERICVERSFCLCRELLTYV